MVQTRQQAMQMEKRNLFSACIPFIADFMVPRDLYSLVFSYKFILRVLDYVMVVKVALLNGNENTKISMEHLYDMTSVKSIWLPSPSRVLRLVNAKKCEHCFRSRVQYTRRGTGLSICFDCLTRLSSPVISKTPKKRTRILEDSDIIRHPRVAAIFDGKVSYSEHARHLRYFQNDKYFLWNAPLFSPAFHEHIGPIFLRADFEVGLSRDSNPREIDNYINGVLQASDPEQYEDLNDAIRAYRGDGYKKLEEKKRLKMMRMKVSRLNRIKRVVKMLSKLASLIHPRYSFLAEAYEIDQNYTNYYPSNSFIISDHPCVTMEDLFVDELLQPYIIYPTKLVSIDEYNSLARQIEAYAIS